MTEIRLEPNNISSIERPRCPHCTCRMMVARIVPGSPKSELCSFECGTCGHSIKDLTAEDPMTSRCAGWLNADLRAPE